MVTTTFPDTVTIPSDLVLEVLGALHGLDNYFCELLGWKSERAGAVSPSKLGDWCGSYTTDLRRAAFGGPTEPDAAADDDVDDLENTWPPEVEQWARGAEKAAELVQLHLEEELDALRDRLLDTFGEGTVQQLREEARKTRSAGRVDYWTKASDGR